MTDVSQEEVRERQRAFRQNNAYEEDEEDDHPGHHGATCRQQ